MPTINTDCNIIMSHPDVNAGADYGFLLFQPQENMGPPVSIQREVDSDGTVSVRVFFDIVLADNLINPDGSEHTQNRDAMYAMLVDYLEKADTLTLKTVIGTISNLGATGHSATEQHYGAASIVSCQFNNAGVYYSPVNNATFSLSVWDGTLTWASSYWR